MRDREDGGLIQASPKRGFRGEDKGSGEEDRRIRGRK